MRRNSDEITRKLEIMEQKKKWNRNDRRPPPAPRAGALGRRQKICSRAATPCRKRSLPAARSTSSISPPARPTARFARLAAMAKGGRSCRRRDRPAQARSALRHRRASGRCRHGRGPRLRHGRRDPRKREKQGEAPLIVLCDDLSDPHNLGAIIRTAGARRTASSSRSAAASA